MDYDHTQYSPLHWLMHALGVGLLALAWCLRDQPGAAAIVLSVAGLTFCFGFCFRWLRVTSGSTSVTMQYGPLPIFRSRVDYADITDVAPGRSSWIDGWGIHWVPYRGWTYNLWGFDCAVLQLGDRVVRIGTDDREHLVQFLSERIATIRPGPPAADVGANAG